MSGSAVNVVEIPLPEGLADRLEVKLARTGLTVDQMLGDERVWKGLLDAIPRRETPGRVVVICACCRPGTCQRVLYWRGKHRCACPIGSGTT
jgi:hypothetical protein